MHFKSKIKMPKEKYELKIYSIFVINDLWRSWRSVYFNLEHAKNDLQFAILDNLIGFLLMVMYSYWQWNCIEKQKKYWKSLLFFSSFVLLIIRGEIKGILIPFKMFQYEPVCYALGLVKGSLSFLEWWL